MNKRSTNKRKSKKSVASNMQAHEEIFDQESLLKSALISIPYPLCIMDIDSYKVLTINSAATKHSILPKNTTCYALMHKRDKPCSDIGHPCPIEEIKKTRQPVVLEHIHYDKDGNARCVEVHSYPIFGNKGNITHMIECCVDVTEHKQAEDALRESEQKYHQLFENESDAVMILDAQTLQFEDANKATLDMFGYTKSEFCSLTVYDISAEKDKTKLAVAKVKNDQQGANKVSLRYMIKKDGTIFPTEIAAGRFISKGRTKIIGSVRDTTERKKTEHALRDSEHKYRVLAESSPDAVFVTTPEGKCLYANGSAAAFLGKKPAEIIGKNVTDLFPNQVSETLLVKMKEVVEQDNAVSYEVAIPSGLELYYFSTIASPIYDDDGTMTSILGVAHDITKRKNAEEGLLRYASIVSSSSDMMALLDVNFVYLAANEAYLSAFGLTKDEVIGRTASEVFGEEFFETIIKPNAERCLEGNKVSYGNWFQFPVLGSRYMLITYSPYISQNREIKGFVVNACDITERKQAEEEREDLAKFPSENPNPVLRITKDGEVLFSNQAGELLLGAWGSGIGKTVPPKWRNFITQAFTSKKTTEEEVEEVKDKIFSITITPIKEAGYANLYACDITERKKAEQGVRFHEKRLEALLHLNRMVREPQEDILDFVRNKAIEITKSKFSFIGFLNEDESVLTIDSWSKEAMAQCSVMDQPTHFPVAQAGLWAEPVRQRKPIVVNDYNTYSSSKKGYPKGHVPIKRFLCIPVFEGNRIVAVAAVANKEKDYGQADIFAFTSMMNDMWQLIRYKQAEEKLKTRNEELKTREKEITALAEFPAENPNPVLRISREGVILYANEVSSPVLETWDRKVGQRLPELCSKRIEEVFRSGKGSSFEFKCLDGRLFLVALAPIIDAGYANVYGLDITERKNAELRLLLSEKILKNLNQKAAGLNIIRDILKLIKESVGFEAVGIRLREGDDFPYFAVEGFSDDFVERENYLCSHCPGSEQLCDSKRKPRLECMCGTVLLGLTDASLPFFTKTGSFYTNSTTELLKSTSPNELQCHLRGHCNIAGYESVALIPLRSVDKIVGLLQLNDTHQGRFTLEMVHFFEGIGASIGTALSRIRAEEQLRMHRLHLEDQVRTRTEEVTRTNEQLLQEIEDRKRLEKEILDISEREKRLIGRTLHDSIGQQLAGIAFMTEVLEQKLDSKSLSEASYASKITSLAHQSMNQARSLAKGLHPIDLEENNLTTILQDLAITMKHLFGISCTFEFDKPIEINDAEVVIHLYRIAQEAITNATKHGRAKNVHIRLANGKGQITLTVENDGLNFPKKPKKKGLGLKIMEYRAEMINGTFDIRQRKQGGTILRCAFPNNKH